MKAPYDERSPEGAAFERQAKVLFDDSAERLDARTRSKLTQARNTALDELHRVHGSGARWHGFRMPVTGFGAALIAALAMILWQGHEPTVAPGVPPLDDLEIVADAESLELLQEVEFYAWLDQR